MGMVFEAVAVTPEQVAAVRDDEEVVLRLLFGDDEGADLPGGPPGDATAWAEAMARLGRVDLDKSWHGLHFLLTGTAWESSGPLGAAILGGRPVGEDAGYGPPRLLEPAEVTAVAAALARVDPAGVRARYDPAELEAADVYPDGLWADPLVLDEYLLPNLAVLTGFYARAAAEGKGVLMALT